jgi:hypothetical protein
MDTTFYHKSGVKPFTITLYNYEYNAGSSIFQGGDS